MIVIAKNQTAGALALDQLPVPGNEIPASGQVTLTDYVSIAEIQQDPQLLAHIVATDAIVNVDGVDLSTADSEAFVSTVPNTTFTDTEDGLTPASGEKRNQGDGGSRGARSQGRLRFRIGQGREPVEVGEPGPARHLAPELHAPLHPLAELAVHGHGAEDGTGDHVV